VQHASDGTVSMHARLWKSGASAPRQTSRKVVGLSPVDGVGFLSDLCGSS
jgi:hypothetical protein